MINKKGTFSFIIWGAASCILVVSESHFCTGCHKANVGITGGYAIHAQHANHHASLTFERCAFLVHKCHNLDRQTHVPNFQLFGFSETLPSTISLINFQIAIFFALFILHYYLDDI